MTEKFSNYDYTDYEAPLIFKPLNDKINKQFMKNTNPDVKPHVIFDGYSKPKTSSTKKNKTGLRKSKRLNKKGNLNPSKKSLLVSDN
tara:strand:- start:110 stop:370 length:261 start_codon:yes stop_codon:yes gene_type:complete